MKKFIVVLVAMVFVFAASYASAEGPYVSGNIGTTLSNDATTSIVGIPGSADMEYDTGFSIGGAVGYDLGNNARVEGEVAYRTADLDRVSGPGSFALTGELNVLSFLLNGYYDIKVDAPVTPFITGGIGFANTEIEDSGDSVDDNVFAYQIGAGLSYAVNNQMTLDCGYRYMGTSDPEFEDSGVQVDSEYSSHNFYVGLRYPIK